MLAGNILHKNGKWNLILKYHDNCYAHVLNIIIDYQRACCAWSTSSLAFIIYMGKEKLMYYSELLCNMDICWSFLLLKTHNSSRDMVVCPLFVLSLTLVLCLTCNKSRYIESVQNYIIMYRAELRFTLPEIVLSRKIYDNHPTNDTHTFTYIWFVTWTSNYIEYFTSNSIIARLILKTLHSSINQDNFKEIWLA